MAGAEDGEIFDVQVDRQRAQRLDHRLRAFQGAEGVDRVQADACPAAQPAHQPGKDSRRETVVVFDGQKDAGFLEILA